MLVAWYANTMRTSNLKPCKTMSIATRGSRVLSYCLEMYSEVSLMVLTERCLVQGKKHVLISHELRVPGICYTTEKHMNMGLPWSYMRYFIYTMTVSKPPPHHAALFNASFIEKPSNLHTHQVTGHSHKSLQFVASW